MLLKSRTLKGSKGAGLRYEKKVLKELRRRGKQGELPGKFVEQQWVEYIDDTGKHICQPDAFIVTKGAIFVFEIKLSQTDTAWSQLFELYIPCLKYIYDRPVYGVQICKNVVPNMAGAKIDCISQFCDSPSLGFYFLQLLL